MGISAIRIASCDRCPCTEKDHEDNWVSYERKSSMPTMWGRFVIEWYDPVECEWQQTIELLCPECRIAALEPAEPKPAPALGIEMSECCGKPLELYPYEFRVKYNALGLKRCSGCNAAHPHTAKDNLSACDGCGTESTIEAGAVHPDCGGTFRRLSLCCAKPMHQCSFGAPGCMHCSACGNGEGPS